MRVMFGGVQINDATKGTAARARNTPSRAEPVTIWQITPDPGLGA
jgi:hypothetical protein